MQLASLVSATATACCLRELYTNVPRQLNLSNVLLQVNGCYRDCEFNRQIRVRECSISLFNVLSVRVLFDVWSTSNVMCYRVLLALRDLDWEVEA